MILIRGAFPDEREQLRFAYSVRNPSDRVVSQFFHVTTIMGATQLQLEVVVRKEFDTTIQCLRTMAEKHGISLHDVLSWKVDWYSCAGSLFIGSFYALHLRPWVCELQFWPKGLDCPTFASGGLDGTLSDPTLSQILFVDYRDVSGSPERTVKSILRHARLPTELRVPPAAKGPGGSTQASHVNAHNHTTELSPQLRVRLIDADCDVGRTVRSLVPSFNVSR